MPELLSKKIGRKPLFDKAFEDMLVNYALIMEDKLYGLTQMDMRRIAYQLAIRNNLSNPFKDEKAGRYWLKGFLSRHRQILSMRKPSETSFARASGFTKERMNEFYDNLDKVYDEKKFTADRIFNVDETGLSIVQSKYPKIIARRGKKQIGAITSAERGLAHYNSDLYESCWDFCSANDNFPPQKYERNFNERRTCGIDWTGTSIWLDTDIFVHSMVPASY
ncbi:unnamed protein product [Acanthoscelides obtectus]|uniref:HTH CENPB-type domain-containing protein n=1 Tax=Acanthoscelides obtectus TaxID=200917 RepID=A0A9P0KSB7_ACAOB|nr:unnamed protein product [Acanthoscelides obtectus]CAK1669212.1 hypothetical protein AOBTE_LOCUS26872 [Acanthoscelides obtectus]